jgi:hypothetical protein
MRVKDFERAILRSLISYAESLSSFKCSDFNLISPEMQSVTGCKN